jgi:hypothetical protein
VKEKKEESIGAKQAKECRKLILFTQLTITMRGHIFIYKMIKLILTSLTE